MPNPDPERVRVSLRLKAARYLAGRADDDGKPMAMPIKELARHPLMVTNGISRNRLEEIEQIKTTARPMELEKIAIALRLPESWFVEPAAVSQSDAAEQLLLVAEQVARELRRAGEVAAATADAPGHRKPGAGGVGA